MEVLKKPWIETPLIESKILSRAAGCRIFLKLENLQPGTSFKSRGIGNLMLNHVIKARDSPSTRPLHFYSSSGGNAGLACVAAAETLGFKSTIVVPESTEKAMILKLISAGASEVIVHGKSWMYADQHLQETIVPEAKAKGEMPVYVPPFDHPWVWQGAATMMEEIHRQIQAAGIPDAVICSVGGGGLFAGIMQGLDQVGWGESVQVLAVETFGADSLAQSLQQNSLVTLPGITSIALSLGAVRVANQAYEQAQRSNVTSVVLEDAEAAMGVWKLLDDERILVEPACGVSVALAYDGRLKKYIKNFGPESKVVIVVCGGCRTDLETVYKWKADYMARASELGVLHQELEDVPSTVLQNGCD